MSEANEPIFGISKRARDKSLTTVNLFLFSIIFGTIYISYAKLHHFSQLVVTSGPIIIMVAFAIVMVAAPRFRVRDDQAGDNLYYMGFIFTLVSLALALYQFREEDKTAIVQNFGVAIASTICGITLRIIFAGMRQDPVEVERQARLELAEAARLVKIELDSTAVEFSAFSRSMKQILEDRFADLESMQRDINSRLTIACEQFFISIEEAGRRSNERIDETSTHASETIAELAKEMTAPIDEASAYLKETLKNTASSLTGSLNSISKNIGNQGAKIVENNEKINVALVGGIQDLLVQLRLLNDKFKELETPEKAINLTLTPAVDALVDRVNRFEAASDDLARKNSATFESAIKTQGEKMREALERIENASAEVAKAVNRLCEVSAQNREVNEGDFNEGERNNQKPSFTSRGWGKEWFNLK